MVIRLIVSVVLIFINLQLFSQKQEERIIWSKTYKLTWEDFKGRPKSSMNVGAVTASGFDFPVYEYKSGIFTVKIDAVFDINKSWVKDDDKINSLLEHEQLHFDITELYARKFRRVILETKFKKNGKRITKQFQKISDSISKKWDAYQDLYDKETDLSREESKQKEWLLKIARELEELEAYSNHEITIDLNKKK